MPDADTAVFEAECGKGTYVRALARDLGRLLGCFGHVIALRRTAVGPFGEDDAVTLDELRRIGEAEGAATPSCALLLPVERRSTTCRRWPSARRTPPRWRAASRC